MKKCLRCESAARDKSNYCAYCWTFVQKRAFVPRVTPMFYLVFGLVFGIVAGLLVWLGRDAL